MRIDFEMVRISQYEVLHHFTRKLCEAAIRAGHTCRLLEGDEIMKTLLNDPPDLTIGFNGCPRNSKNILACDIVQVPHVAILVDPPYHFFYLLPSFKMHIGCDDRTGNAMLEQSGFTRSLLMPHAVEPELNFDPQEERLFDVLVLSTFVDYEEKRAQWPVKFPPKVVNLLEETVEQTFADPRASFITLFDENLQAATLEDPSVFKTVNLVQLLQELEAYVKGKDRCDVVTSVKDVAVHIYGNSVSKRGWKEYLGKKHPNIFAHGPVFFEQALNLMKQSKILLNPNLKNKEGAHERIFAGLATGAAVITNLSSFLEETLVEGEDIHYYACNQLSQIPKIVHTLLGDEALRSKIAASGRVKVMQHHTWDQRFAALMQWIPPHLKNGS